MTRGPTLNYEPDRRCDQAARHVWHRAPEQDIDLGEAFRCWHCHLVRWAEHRQREPRKTTVFHLCSAHAGRGEGRYRLAECFCEGGWADNSPCADDGPCKIRPGTDLFVADMCRQRDWYSTASGTHPFVWPANAQQSEHA